MSARLVRVSGRVQGVFFRDSCRTRALDAGVAGWVRNEADGSVRAHLEGPPEAVAAVEDWMRTGPERAVVEHVDAEDAPVQGLGSFEVR